MVTTKSEAKPNGSVNLIGHAVTVQWLVPHLEPIEGTLRELNQYGAITEAEWRGSIYLSFTPYTSIRSVDARIRLGDEKPSKVEKGEAAK
jgi:hypothetical protein